MTVNDWPEERDRLVSLFDEFNRWVTVYSMYPNSDPRFNTVKDSIAASIFYGDQRNAGDLSV